MYECSDSGACCAVQSGANLVKSASVSNLGGLCKHYHGQPFTAQLPTLSKASDGLGPSQSPGGLDASSCESPLTLSQCLPLQQGLIHLCQKTYFT